ncbi:hypothetical protein NDK47_19920 [Brevibacillus ruminantium]|uniref:YopA central domain-containing protein n=1 Tax=Brevibacillus ruminantium TaxID=2950604 RepID=A0ABY4WBG9_9BACL|nr:hypothetical protein [Brevibacillus ruminantium]USG64398.1 hypothetical protein NDK47_19920 [Brevibacillus ruminantium]
MSIFSFDLEESPSPLQSNFLRYQVNEDIVIYKGYCYITIEPFLIPFLGEIKIKWLPVPRLDFWGELVDNSDVIFLKERTSGYVLTDCGHLGNIGTITTEYNKRKDIISIFGSLQENQLQKDVIEVTCLIFCVVNCKDTGREFLKSTNGEYIYRGRSYFELGDWNVTLDVREDREHYYKILNATVGYGITHIGKLEKKDGSKFTIEECESLLGALQWLLSFISCRNVAICNFKGITNSVDLIWEKYFIPSISGYRNAVTSFPIDMKLECMLEPLHKKLLDPIWKQALPMIFKWYLESQSADHIDNKIISVQPALEMIAWTYLVIDKGKIKQDTFSRELRASDKIRLLLKEIGIELQIPELEDFKILRRWYKDGVHLYTDVRNNIIHPINNKKINSLSDSQKNNILLLGRQYLELCILFLLQYDGKYFNRLNKKYGPKSYEYVPWSIHKHKN